MRKLQAVPDRKLKSCCACTKLLLKFLSDRATARQSKKARAFLDLHGETSGKSTKGEVRSTSAIYATTAFPTPPQIKERTSTNDQFIQNNRHSNPEKRRRPSIKIRRYVGIRQRNRHIFRNRRRRRPYRTP